MGIRVAGCGHSVRRYLRARARFELGFNTGTYAIVCRACISIGTFGKTGCRLTHLSLEIERLNETTQRASIVAHAGPLTFQQVLVGWAAGDAIADISTQLIAESPFAALFWEMPPLTTTRLDNPYECVLIDSPSLARFPCDATPFDEHFGGEPVVVFHNLGADALLVAPAPQPAGAQYAHIAAFCRTAPAVLSNRYWECLGAACQGRICATPTWISTAGLGVGWLHARLDTRPKYYSHAPYRRWP